MSKVIWCPDCLQGWNIGDVTAGNIALSCPRCGRHLTAADGAGSEGLSIMTRFEGIEKCKYFSNVYASSQGHAPAIQNPERRFGTLSWKADLIPLNPSDMSGYHQEASDWSRNVVSPCEPNIHGAKTQRTTTRRTIGFNVAIVLAVVLGIAVSLIILNLGEDQGRQLAHQTGTNSPQETAPSIRGDSPNGKHSAEYHAPSPVLPDGWKKIPDAPSPFGGSEQSRRRLSGEEIYQLAKPAVVSILALDSQFKSLGTGTGFFVSADGLLVTNHHVIDDATILVIKFHDGTSQFVNSALVLNEQWDLAVLRVDGASGSYLNIRDEPLPSPGARVFALGHPLDLEYTFTEGIVSAIRDDPLHKTAVIQTSAPISPGNSGGPLLDEYGEVVGVNTFVRTDGQNINFAIAVPAINYVIANARTSRPRPLAQTTKTTKMFAAWFTAMCVGDWTAAHDIALKFCRELPQESTAWTILGETYLNFGQLLDATEAYSTAVRLNPTNAIAHERLVDIYVRTNFLPGAFMHYQVLLQLDPAAAIAVKLRYPGLFP